MQPNVLVWDGQNWLMKIDHDCDVFVIDSSNFYNVCLKKKTATPH